MVDPNPTLSPDDIARERFTKRIAGLIDDRAVLENKRWLGVKDPDILSLLKAREIVKILIYHTLNNYEDAAQIADAFAHGQKNMANEEGSDDGLKAGLEASEFIATAIRRKSKLLAEREATRTQEPIGELIDAETAYEKLCSALIAERDRMDVAKNNVNLSELNRHGAHQSKCALDRVLKSI